MAADITIYKKNNLYLFIDTPLDINREIYDLFSFFLKGYEFMPSYKYGTFDGKKHLYDINRHELPIGLLSDLLKFAQKNSYSVKLEDKTEILPINYNNEIDEFMSKIQSYTNKSLSGVYEFQRIAVERALRKQRQLLLSPTSSGKSNVIYLIVRFLLEYTDLKILLLVPSTGLVEQMVSDFASYVNDGYDIESQCHKIYGGKEKGTDKRITVSTWQSLHMIGDLDKEGNQLGLPFDLSYFNHDVLICDECLHPDTLIKTNVGNVAIKNLVICDEVLTYNEISGIKEYNKIEYIHKNISKKEKKYKLTFEDSSELLITGNHKILTNNGWVEAQHLNVEDIVLSV